jgi:MYXO-CTERM domain-containing protein
MRVAKGYVQAVFFVVLALAPGVHAASVGYTLTSGQVTAVTLNSDQTNRLSAPVDLDAGQVTVDFVALQLDILSVSATGPGVVQLGGLNGWTSVSFSNASFSSTQSTALTSGGAGVYNYGVPVSVVADLTLNPGNVVVNDFSAQSGATGSILALNGNQTVDITVNGVVLGALQDPVVPTAPPVVVKADFHFIASQTPEPAAGALALLAVLALAGWRRIA